MNPPKRILILALTLAVEVASAAGVPRVVRGATSILLRAPGGPLTFTLSKRDLNIYPGPDTLTAYVMDPCRRMVATFTLPDDGADVRDGAKQAVQSHTVRIADAPAGVYRVTLAGGSDLVYGFETNAPQYLLLGQPTLNDGTVSGRLYFPPPKAAFTVALAALHEPGRQVAVLRDAKGATVGTFDVTGKQPKVPDLFGPRTTGGYTAGAKASIAADQGARDGLWSLELKAFDVRLEIPGLSGWTTAPDAWFDPSLGRFLLLPYGQARYVAPGQTATARYELRNTTGRPGTFELTLRGEPGLSARVMEPAGPVTLPAGEAVAVRVEASLAAGREQPAAAVLSARAKDNSEVTASVALTLRPGSAPALRPLAGPVVLRPYEHENLLLGYAPDYVTNEVYFDGANTAYIRQRDWDRERTTGMTALLADGWAEWPFVAAMRAVVPDFVGTSYGAGFAGAKVAFDGRNGVYTLVRARSKREPTCSLLLFSPDGGRQWRAYRLPGHEFDLEQFTGHNAPAGPPPVLTYTRTRPHPAPFCGYYDLDLWLPRREGDQLVLGQPVRVSDNCLGACQHSGGPASTVTREGRTHVVWGEVTGDDQPGVPSYVATYDRATGRLGPRVFCGHAPPVNDVHNVPAVTMDRDGIIHILTGAHGDHFRYLRSLKPNDLSGGLTAPENILNAGYIDAKNPAPGAGRQTYISLVCGPDGTLYTAYRQWRSGVDPYHPGGYYAALSFQSKPPGGAWSEAKPLVIPPLPNYSIYYHKLTIDRRGRLFIAYSYFSGQEAYQSDWPSPYLNSAVQTSSDGGRTWRLATTQDFR